MLGSWPVDDLLFATPASDKPGRDLVGRLLHKLVIRSKLERSLPETIGYVRAKCEAVKSPEVAMTASA